MRRSCTGDGMDADSLEAGAAMFGGDINYDFDSDNDDNDGGDGGGDDDDEDGKRHTTTTMMSSMFSEFSAELSNGFVDEPPPPLPPPPTQPPVQQPSIVIIKTPSATATLRRRPPRGSATQLGAEMPFEQPSPQPSLYVRASRWLLDSHERFELWRIDASDRCSLRLERWYAMRRRILACFCMLALVAVAVIVSMTRVSDPHAFVVDSRASYVRHGHDGVNLSVPTEALTCAELETGIVRRPQQREPPLLERVRATAERLLDEDELECVCAPMFGSRRRYIAVDTASAPLHLYNPALDTAWAGELDGKEAGRLNVSEWLLVENQRMLFPERTADVRVVRRSAIRVAYRDAACSAAAVVLQAERAYCVQACLDLLDGKSVYDVAEGEEEEEEAAVANNALAVDTDDGKGSGQ